MATQIISRFTRYALTNEELLNGAILTPLQAQVMQNELATAAETLVNFEIDPSDPKNVRDHAYQKAAVDIFLNIIDRSIAAEKALHALQGADSSPTRS